MAAVLLVEDDEQVRVLAESILRDAGHTVVTATGIDGSQALLDAEKPVDVLFVDITLGNDPEAGLKTAEICRQHGITEQTYYRWKAKYGGMESGDAKKMKQLEDENRKLKHVVAELTLDKVMLQDVLARKL